MRSAALVVASALALGACTSQSAPPAQTRSRGLQDQRRGLEKPAELTPREERALKKQSQQPENGTRISPIDWSEADKFARLELDPLPADAAERLAQAPVPALLPDRPALLAHATLTGGEHWYAASLDGEGHSVYVSGSNKQAVVPGLELAEARPDLKDDFHITRNEAIVSLTFNAFGAAYVLEVECAKPTSDVRCTEDDYVVGLANDLALANPGGRR